MSGRSPSAKPGPVFFTQQEIDALSAGRRPKTVTRQLKTVRTPAARPARPRGGIRQACAAIVKTQ